MVKDDVDHILAGRFGAWHGLPEHAPVSALGLALPPARSGRLGGRRLSFRECVGDRAAGDGIDLRIWSDDGDEVVRIEVTGSWGALPAELGDPATERKLGPDQDDDRWCWELGYPERGLAVIVARSERSDDERPAIVRRVALFPPMGVESYLETIAGGASSWRFVPP